MVLVAVKSVAPGLLFFRIWQHAAWIEKKLAVSIMKGLVLWLCSAMLSKWDIFARLTLKVFGGQWIAYIKR